MVAVIKCPTGPWRGLPWPQAMLMNPSAGQCYLISRRPTIWWEGRAATTISHTPSRVTNAEPEVGSNFVN